MPNDPVEVASKMYRVLFENDRVRALDVRMKPGEKGPMHTHPSLVSYSFTGGRLKILLPDGTVDVVNNKPGNVLWLDGQPHSVENLGATEVHDLTIELKKQV